MRNLLLLLALFCLAQSCGARQPELAAPRPALAGSREAQTAFRRILARWLEADRSERAELEAPIREYLGLYPEEDQARLARIYLAWILIQRRELAQARALVAEARSGPAGSVRDFAVITEAAIQIRLGKATSALELLVPLQGKIIDPTERLVFGEQLVQAALASRRWRRAAQYMLDWLAQAPAQSRDAVQQAVVHQLPRIPSLALERIVESLDQEASDPAAAEALIPARDWLRRALRSHLATVALARSDVSLAQRLLESSGAQLRRGELGAKLIRLATSGRLLPRVAGRAVGLVLSLRDPDARQRSAELAMGMSRALGLPAAASQPGAVRLLTHDEAGEAGDMQEALWELAGAGAAILVAGVDERGGSEGARFAELAGIPVMLVQHAPASIKSDYAFWMGVDPDRSRALLDEALSRAGVTDIVHIGPAGLPCNVQAERAGRPRFPVHEWKRRGVDALVMTGDARCTREAIREVRSAGLRARLGLGVACAELAPTLEPSLGAFWIAFGAFPMHQPRSAPESMRRWRQAIGAPPSYYHVLGHDAAVLAATALADFPLDVVDDAREVAKLHRRARAALAHAQAELWSSHASGFLGGQQLQRQARIEGASATDAGP